RGDRCDRLPARWIAGPVPVSALTAAQVPPALLAGSTAPGTACDVGRWPPPAPHHQPRPVRVLPARVGGPSGHTLFRNLRAGHGQARRLEGDTTRAQRSSSYVVFPRRTATLGRPCPPVCFDPNYGDR